MYCQRNISLKLEIWSLFCMDLQKERDSNAHGSGWMLITCKHWNWNWHWDWKYHIFLSKGSYIVRLTASSKLLGLLITWSRKNVKPYICPSTILMASKIGRVETYGGKIHLQSHVTFWFRAHVTNEKNLYLHFRSTYEHQNWQVSSLLSEDTTYLVEWPFGHVATWQI